jgi:hypothetical protein
MKMMRKKMVILYFFLLQTSLSAMELIPINDPYFDPIDSIVDIIDTAVNTKYSTNAFADFFTQSFLTEPQLLDIVHILTQRCSIISKNFITALCKKNNFIAIAVMHFSCYARKNLNSVTIDTLQTINHAHTEQPTAELNVLPLSFKKYIMEDAFNNTKHSYIIPLEHDDYIMTFDICAPAHLVATSTRNQKNGSNVIVWDLKTGKRAQEITTEAAVASLCFNGTGSHLAASTGYNDGYSIKIWNPTAGTELYTIPIPSNILHLGYMDNTAGDKNVLLCHRSGGLDKRIIIDEWALTTKEPLHKRSCAIFAQYYMPYGYKQGNYHVIHPLDHLKPLSKDNILEVKKKNCNHLYVLEKAIINSTTANALQKLQCMQLFQDLTEYEKNKLQEMYIKKGTH